MKNQIQKLLMVGIVFVLGIAAVQAERLPVVGEDENSWGTLLNDFLLVSHTTGGYLADFYVNGSKIIFEGATANDNLNLTLEIADPTGERIITFPDASGEVCLLGQTIEGGELAPDISITTTGNIVLDSTDSEFKILSYSEDIETKNYGIFDVVDMLSEDRYYTFPDITGTVVVYDPVTGIAVDSAENGNSITTTGNIILDSSSSDLWIMDNDESGYYGIFDVDSLSEDTYYTFPDITGTVVVVDDSGIIDGSIYPNSLYIANIDIGSEGPSSGTFTTLNAEDLSISNSVSLPTGSIQSDAIEDGVITKSDMSTGFMVVGNLADGSSGWVPDADITRSFTITADAGNVLANSAILVSLGANTDTAAVCSVTTRTALTNFVVGCSSAPDDGATLQYVIIN